MSVHFPEPDIPLYESDQHARRLAAYCVTPPIVILLVSLYLMIFTRTLDGFAFGPVSWAALVSVAQFVIAVGVGIVYLTRSQAQPTGRRSSDEH